MDRTYRQFGQGLSMRGNTRPSIPTAGAWGFKTGTSSGWGANYNEGDIAQRHFLISKHMKNPTIPTAYGLSTQQKAYQNLINPTENGRASFNAGLTGTGGFYVKTGRISKRTAGSYKKRKKTCRRSKRGARRTGGGLENKQISASIANAKKNLLQKIGTTTKPVPKPIAQLTDLGAARAAMRRAGKLPPIVPRKRTTGGAYSFIRNAINKASTGGFTGPLKRSNSKSKSKSDANWINTVEIYSTIHDTPRGGYIKCGSSKKGEKSRNSKSNDNMNPIDIDSIVRNVTPVMVKCGTSRKGKKSRN